MTATDRLAFGQGPRALEARLLTGAILLVVAAGTLLGWSVDRDLPPAGLITGMALAIIALVAHVAVRATAPDADGAVLPLVMLLNGIGLVLIRRVDLATGDSLAAAQTIWTAVAVGALGMALLFLRDVRDLSRYQYTLGLATIVLLLLPLIGPISAGVINGAQLWIDVFGMRFQPGEVAKITLVLFLAAYLERNRQLLAVATQRLGPMLVPAPRHLAPLLLAVGIAVIIMAGLRDLGSALLVFGTVVAMLYAATGRVAYPVIGGFAFAAATFVVFHQFAHVQRRFEIWLDPWADVQGASYQLVQSLFALGTGGLTGTGLGFGRPQDIPFAATDAVFVVAGEELGLLGATALLVVYLLLIVRGFRIAQTAQNEFSTLVALGLTVTLALQIFVIIGGLTRMVPLTGITLPFVSYGGSSLLANYLVIALLLRISDDSRAAATGRRQPTNRWLSGTSDPATEDAETA